MKILTAGRLAPISIRTNHVYPPIPIRGYDWEAWFDGREEYLTGRGPTEIEAIADLRAQHIERLRETRVRAGRKGGKVSHTPRGFQLLSGKRRMEIARAGAKKRWRRRAK